MKRFALDLGTQSIGWCVLETNKEAKRLLDLGVRVFPDGREPGRNGRMGDPLNIKRRMARQLRRNIERRKRRKAAMYRFLDGCGSTPKGAEAKAWRLLDPYRLRAEAISRNLSNLELGRVLINLATRRGFKSNRKTDEKDAEAKGQALRQKNLTERLGTSTLGQYLDALHMDPKARLRFRADSDFFPTRAMYEDEFARIRVRQESVHPKFDWDRAYRIIFFQRPLRRPERASCTFYPEEFRGYRALPSAQRFRILQDINNLNYSDASGRSNALTIEQKKWLFEKMSRQLEIRFEVLRSEWDISSPFNLESRTRDKLKGDFTSVKLRKLLGPIWDKMSHEEQDVLVEALIVEENDDTLRNMLRNQGLVEANVDLILSLDLPIGVASVSARFMREVAAIMEREWCGYDEAVLALGLHHSDLPSGELRDRLPYYGEVLRYSTVLPKSPGKLTERELQDPEMAFGRIPNPTVHIALNQLRKLVNALIDRYGRPDEVVLEFATELKKGRKALEAILKIQEENKKKNDYIKDELRALIGRGGEYRPSRNDIRKYVLWEELGNNHAGRVCVYCGGSIGAAQLVNGEAEIEHIIPFSRSLDDSMANLTVAHKQCNLAKGDRSPFEAFGASPYGYNWEGIFERAKNFKGYRKRMRFAPDAIERLQENGDFIASQLTDTAYIAKAARDYLSSVCPKNKVWAIPGQLTAEFRSQWGLNTILSTGLGKNRSDHRHHAIDAIVVGLSDRGMLQAAAVANAAQDGGKIRAPAFALDRGDVIDHLKTVLISVKPDHGKGGALLAETAYGYRMRMPENTDDSSEQEYEYRVRKPVRSLSFVEIERRIIDPLISKMLVDHLSAHCIEAKTNTKTLEAALVDFEATTGIRRIRIHPKNESRYLRLEAGSGGRSGVKAYQFADILCADIWMLPRGIDKVEYQGDFFNRGEVPPDSEEPPTRRPTSGAKHLMRLYKNDVIRIRKKEGDTFARIAGFSGTNNKLDIQPLFSSDSIAAWLEQTSKAFVDRYWQPKSGQNFVSINALFKRDHEFDSISKVAISIDGRLRRR